MEKLVAVLNDYSDKGTPAERKIARYFMDNLPQLPFETAASIADQLKLSPMTVGRFLRRLGYQGFSSIKVQLDGKGTGNTSPAKAASRQSEARSSRSLAGLMAQQIQVLQGIYDLSSDPKWEKAVRLALSADEVFVASCGDSGNFGRYFARQLNHSRRRVHYLEGADGSYVELFDRSPADTLLVLLDCRMEAANPPKLADAAHRSGFRTLLVTRQPHEWENEDTGVCLTLPAPPSGVIDNATPLAALLDFFLVSLKLAGGEESGSRTRRVSELRDMFASSLEH